MVYIAVLYSLLLICYDIYLSYYQFEPQVQMADIGGGVIAECSGELWCFESLLVVKLGHGYGRE